jgi:hypothetical protein
MGETTFRSKIDFAHETGCWPWVGAVDAYGYGQFQRCTKAHRFSWQVHRGPIPNGKCVLHRCDNRRCVNPAHLFIGSHADNNKDMAKKGRHGRRKITNDQVREIRASSLTQKELGRKYGLDQTTISDIKLGYTFKYVSGGTDG